MGCASQAGLHGRRSEGCRVNDTALRRWRDEASIFFSPVLFDLLWSFSVDNEQWGWEWRHFNLMVNKKARPQAVACFCV